MDRITNPFLRAIADKVIDGVPISDTEALQLLTTDHIQELGAIAHHVRTTLHGDQAFYGVNMNLNYTNVCELRCPLCAYSCDPGDPQAFLVTPDEAYTRVKTAGDIDEVHIVGGLRPDLPLEYFEELLTSIRRARPDIFIVGFTAAEYDYFARINNLSIEEVFTRLMDAGLGALPGGGAEVFAPEIRQQIAPKKIDGSRWLEVMEIAHGMGLKTNATLLYNHLEQPAHIIDHLHRLRETQDKTGGFKTFVPLAFHDENTKIRARRRSTTGFQDLRLYATARIYLHNVPHIKGLWMYVGEKMAQMLLLCGVDDIGATYAQEKVVHAAGATTADYGSEAFLQHLITDAGLTPVRVRADYRPTGASA